jgi:putative transposase
VRPRVRRSANAPAVAPDVKVAEPNDLWTVDFKGWWRARDGNRCEPLTVRDAFSRFVLEAQLLENTRSETVRRRFERLFELHGVPTSIQVDNGSPFASVHARLGLTTLSAWWVSVGVRVIRGRPAHPEDNGCHERMHLDMRYEVEDVGADDVAAQQTAMDRWRHEFNHVRPHEALDQRTPATLYRRSSRPYRGQTLPKYPAHLVARKVSSAGRLKFRGVVVRVGDGLGGYTVGVEQTGEASVRVQFYELDLGEFALLK